jgi:hypothetical protein
MNAPRIVDNMGSQQPLVQGFVVTFVSHSWGAFRLKKTAAKPVFMGLRGFSGGAGGKPQNPPLGHELLARDESLPLGRFF